ncbi:MAG: Holliday junction resolvase RuvX [Xanthomonadales bacterium]|nr:Holliday junction resolvase RuvX [Xanthomonadales bacterium]
MSDRTDPGGCALAFDVGSRWLGVAIGNALSHSARPLGTIDRQAENTEQRVRALLAEWRPTALVVGDPLDIDGGEQEATRIARRFARQLRHWSGLPVALMDERFSSREADARHTHGRRQGTARRKHAAHQDAGAAQVILERWLDAGMPYPEPTP